jgi:hypothetical protein
MHAMQKMTTSRSLYLIGSLNVGRGPISALSSQNAADARFGHIDRRNQQSMRPSVRRSPKAMPTGRGVRIGSGHLPLNHHGAIEEERQVLLSEIEGAVRHHLDDVTTEQGTAAIGTACPMQSRCGYSPS